MFHSKQGFSSVSIYTYVSGRLAVSAPAVPAPSHTQDRSFPSITGIGGQCGKVVSDFQLEFGISGTFLLLRSRISSPSIPSAGRAAAGADCLRVIEICYSEEFSVFSGTVKLPGPAGRPGVPSYAPLSILAVPTLGPLSPLHRSTSEGNVRALRST